MPRGVRKEPLVKLQEELKEVQNSIQQCKNDLVKWGEKEKEIKDKIMLAQFKEVTTLLDDRNMSLVDLKQLLITN